MLGNRLRLRYIKQRRLDRFSSDSELCEAEPCNIVSGDPRLQAMGSTETPQMFDALRRLPKSSGKFSRSFFDALQRLQEVRARNVDTMKLSGLGPTKTGLSSTKCKAAMIGRFDLA